jgi:16S rRNA A1518/A1519 N6-dimethyltransferase RsmA/KsgA/DIM1 with predicted DNA glycosylase/AP lyase activity
MDVIDVKVLYQQYYTPSELAKQLVELADIQPTDDVLEPSAGQGAIVKEILKKEYDRIVLLEIDKTNVNALCLKFDVY